MSAPRHDLPTDPPLSRLYRQQALAEPSAAVDQRVLVAARQALAAPAPRHRQGWWQRWRLPLSLASTVMLTAMLALLVERQPAEFAGTPSGENKMELESAQKRAEPASVAPAPAPAKVVRTPAPPPPASPARSAAPAAAVEATASDENRPAPARLAAPSLAPMQKSTADSARSPAAWLDEIRALRRAGKAEEAERQLSEFRLAYPDFPLSEEFRQ